MENNIQFVTDLGGFLQMVLAALNSETNYQILISGTFDHSLFKVILDNIMLDDKINKCKVLIPYIGNYGVVSRGYLNKISNAGGEIRMNSSFKKSLIVIGKEVFILSLSSKYMKDFLIKSNFECAVHTDDIKTVNNIYETFENVWDKSLPIVNA